MSTFTSPHHCILYGQRQKGVYQPPSMFTLTTLALLSRLCLRLYTAPIVEKQAPGSTKFSLRNVLFHKNTHKENWLNALRQGVKLLFSHTSFLIEQQHRFKKTWCPAGDIAKHSKRAVVTEEKFSCLSCIPILGKQKQRKSLFNLEDVIMSR